MEFNWFTRAVARVVLASYVTQMFVPVVHAMELDTRQLNEFEKSSRRYRHPSPPGEKALQQPLIKSLQESVEPQIRSEFMAFPSPAAQGKTQDILQGFLENSQQSTASNIYQYQVSVKTLSSQNEKFQVKLSRKNKGSLGSFERLHTALISQGRLASKSSDNKDEDELLTLFKGASVSRKMNHDGTVCFLWNIPGVGTLKIARDGTVIFDQGNTAPFISSYDLVLKTSGDLFIQSLEVAALTLNPKSGKVSKTTSTTLQKTSKILGIVSAHSLHTDHKVVNLGGLRTKQVIGEGKFINNGVLHLEGTEEFPAMVGIRQFINQKSDLVPLKPYIESLHLHITPENEFFYNAKGAELKVAGTLVASPIKNHAVNTQPRSSFINKGEISLGDGAIIRDSIINSGEWKAHQLWVMGKNFTNTKDATLKVFKNFGTSAFLLNEGEIDAKMINLENGTNTGRIKGDGLHLTVWQNMVNDGIANLQHITGKGSFINQGSLKVQGTEENPTYIGINRFVNQKHEDSSFAPTVEGKHLKALARDDYVDQEPQNLKVQGLLIRDRTCNANPNFNFFSNRSFHNARHAGIDVDTLIVAGSSACSNISCGALFTNEGAIRTKIGEICRDKTRNLGNLTADKLVIKATNFTNDRLANIKVFDELSLNILNKSCRNLEDTLLNKGNIEGKKIRIAAKEHTFRLLPNDMDSASPVARMFEIYWKGLLGVYLKEGTLVCKTHKKEEIVILKNTYGPTSSRGIPADVFSRVEEAVKKQSYPSLEDQNEVLKFALLRGYTPISSLELCNTGQIKAKALEVHNPIANSGEIIAKKVHGLGRMVNFLEGKVHATHLLDLASVSNKGKISGHKLNLKTKEFLMNLNSGEVQAKSLRTGSTLTNKGKIFGERLTTGKLVNFGETEAKDISLWEGQNTGTIIGSKLNVGNEMINSGQVLLNELSGGTFTNQNSLKMAPLEDRPARISAREFYNESTPATVAKVLGNKVTVTDANKVFINKTNSELLVNHLVFSMRETGSFLGLMRYHSETGESYVQKNCRRFSNLGTIKTDVLDVTRDHMGNFGKIETLEFKVRGYLFENKCWELGNNLSALLHVGQSIKAEVSIFDNLGEVLVDNGSFIQESGTFNNDGLWNHQGDINLGTTALHNKGEIKWQNGSWSCEKHELKDPTQLDNQGIWTLDQIRGSGIPRIHNTGVLCLNKGVIEFDAVINEANIIFSGGQHKIGYFANYHLLSFLDQDWFFSDNFFNTIMPNHLQVGLYDGPGEIEVEKNLSYDIQALPKLIRSNGDVSFSKRHSQGRTLTDLEKVNALGKVLFYTPAITTTQDYEIENIGHLELYVDGLFTTHHSFKAPSLTLEADGPLTCGASNAVMGTIAATKGPLTVTAHSIDGRFAKIYGAGPTLVKATKGDILLGAPTTGIDPVFKEYYLTQRFSSAHRLVQSVKPRWAGFLDSYCNGASNGAYFSSADKIILESAADILVDCGAVISEQGSSFKAVTNIQNTAGKFSSFGSTRIDCCNYIHTAKGSAYKDGYPMLPGSGPAILESLGDIEFYVQAIINRASTIRSGEKLLINNVAISKDLPSYKEEVINQSYNWFNGHGWGTDWGWKTQHVFTQSCILQTGELIQINTGDFVISGNMNAPIIAIQATAKGLFHNTSRSRETIMPNDTAIINLTQFAQRQVKGKGFLQLTAEGEIKPEFPFGKAYIPDSNHMLMLENAEYPSFAHIPLNSPKIFNPLRSLSSSILNLSIQAALSEFAGKVYVDGGRGNGLLQTFEHNTAEYRHKNNKSLVTRNDLKEASTAMLLYGLQQVGDIIQQQTFLCLPPSEINPYQSAGDTSGNEITVETQDDQTHLNNRMVGRDILNVASMKQKLIRETHSYTVSHETKECKITQQIAMPQQQFICKNGDVNAFAYTDMPSIGVSTQAGRDVLETAETGEITKAPLILKRTVESNKEEKDGWFSTKTVSETNTSHAISPTTTVARRNLKENAGKRIHLSAAKENAGKKIIYKGESLTTEAAMVNNTHSKNSTTSGMFSDRTDSSSFSTASAEPTELIAKKIILKTDAADFKGTDFVALILEDNTKDGSKIGPSIGISHYSQRSVNESTLAKSDVGCEGWYEVMHPCRLEINQIIRKIDEGEIKLESVLWDKDRTEVIGKFAETVYELKRHHREWAEITQVIPNEALVVVALAITIATQGTGASLFSSVVTSMTGGSMIATATGMSMASAAFTAVCTQAATSFLCHGDLAQTGKDLLSSQGIRALGTAVATAGLIGDGGSMAELSFGQHLAVNGFRSMVRAGVSSAIEKRNLSDTLKDAGISTLVDSISGALAKSIGEAATAKGNPLTYGEHKAAHFGVGALAGSILDKDHPLAGAIKGGIGAMMAEVIAESLVDRQQVQNEVIQDLGLEQGRPLSQEHKDFYEAIYREKLYPAMNTAKLVVASVLASFGHDPSIAIVAAANALENNFAGPGSIPEFGGVPKEIREGSWDILVSAGESVVETAEDMWEHPEEFVKEIALDVIPYGTIAAKVAKGERVGKVEVGIETAFVLTGTTEVKAAAKAGAKVVGKTTKKFVKRMEKRTGKQNVNSVSHANPKAPINRELLHNQLASDQKLNEVGYIIAGKGAEKAFKNEARIVSDYGGQIGDWVKKSSSHAFTSDGRKFQAHWVENVNTAERVEQKIKFVTQ
ncbi:MAG: DUF637 domain-containing protein [Candidatus Paracaedibacter sp.]